MFNYIYTLSYNLMVEKNRYVKSFFFNSFDTWYTWIIRVKVDQRLTGINRTYMIIGHHDIDLKRSSKFLTRKISRKHERYFTHDGIWPHSHIRNDETRKNATIKGVNFLALKPSYGWQTHTHHNYFDSLNKSEK